MLKSLKKRILDSIFRKAVYKIKVEVRTVPKGDPFFLEGVFISSPKKVKFMIENEIYLGINLLGAKGSGILTWDEIEQVSRNPVKVFIVEKMGLSFGFNPTECLVSGVNKTFNTVFKDIN